MSQLFQGFSSDAFAFFIMIRLNNNKAFFEENKAQYEDCLKQPLYALAADMEQTIHDIDPAIETRPQKAVARIRRSTRYTRNKDPYRDFLWIAWRDRSQDSQGEGKFGFYFDMSFESMSCGGGYYCARPAQMAELRKKIELQSDRFARIVQALAQSGLSLCGEDYKKVRVPDDLPPVCRPYYVKKSFYLEKELPIDEETTSPRLVGILKETFLSLKDFYDFIQ